MTPVLTVEQKKFYLFVFSELLLMAYGEIQSAITEGKSKRVVHFDREAYDKVLSPAMLEAQQECGVNFDGGALQYMLFATDKRNRRKIAEDSYPCFGRLLDLGPASAIWDEFVALANIDGLEPYLDSTHDGGGIESWCCLHLSHIQHLS